jgi:hypothetical protein
MSDKTEKAKPEVLDEHGDELIHVPQGQSRLRYLLTIGLVLFLVVIFVVADLFQGTMTGGGGGTDEVFLTWTDPVDGASHEVNESEFFETARLLSTMAHFQIYAPDSMIFGEPDAKRRSRNEPTEEDVASFLVFEKIAEGAGIAVSDDEHTAFLRSRFGGNAGLTQASINSRMSKQVISENARRIERVSKLRMLMLTTMGLPDPDEVVKTWQESRPEFKFQSVSVSRDDFVATAEAEAPDDEALAEWFHGLQDFEQRKLYTEERVQGTVAYLLLDGNYDSTALAAAYPVPEGTDLDQQAQSYFSQFRTTRFKAPEETTEDSEEGAEPQEKPTKLFYDFEEVEEQVRAEAPIHAALSDFVTDLQDRAANGETLDLKAEAEPFGLTIVEGDEAGWTREELTAVEVWGGPQIASQLIFAAEGSILPRVTATEDGFVLAQSVKKIERSEPPFADIRDDVVKMWAEDRAAELAVESLDYLRATVATKPDDVENADWQPAIDWDTLSAAASEASYPVYERPWLERSALPEGQTFATASPINRHLMLTPTVYDMEPGTVAAAAQSSDGKTAFLVRYDGTRVKDESEIDAGTVFQLRGQATQKAQLDFGAKVFLGDGPWLTEKASLRFPKNERREAERAAKPTETAG